MDNQGGEAANHRRNFRALLWDGILFTPALALFEPTTTIPLLVDRLTGSALLVGLVGTLRLAGMWLPALPVANWVKHRQRKKAWVVYGASTRVAIGLLGVALLFSGHLSEGILVGLIFLTHTLFWMGEGCAGLTWTDIVGKCIPENQRGRFFGLMQAFGSFNGFFQCLRLRHRPSHHANSIGIKAAFRASQGLQGTGMHSRCAFCG